MESIPWSFYREKSSGCDKQKQPVSLAQGNLWRGTREGKKTPTKHQTKPQNLGARKSHWCEEGEDDYLSSTVLQINETRFTDFIRNYIRYSHAKRGVNKVSKIM